MLDYTKLSHVLQQVQQNQQNLKSVIYNQFSQNDYSRALAILTKCIKNFKKIQEIAEKLIESSSENNIRNLELFCIYIIEIFFGKQIKKIRGGGQIFKIIKNNKEFIQDQIKEYLVADGQFANTNNNVKQTIQLRLINERIDFSEFIKKYNLDNSEIIKDEQIQNLVHLQYNIYQKLIKQDVKFLKNEDFVIQSKSSCLPPYILFQKIDKQKILEGQFDIIDACSAPGNKSLQLFEYLSGKGNIFSFEKNLKRFDLLQQRVYNQYQYDKKNFICQNLDFLEIDVNSSQYKNVKAILLDPSCSGSGMQSHIFSENILQKIDFKKENQSVEDIINQVYEISDKQRIKKLAQFQIQALEKSASFLQVEYIIYSTCSIFFQENESIVRKFLKKHKEQFKLVTINAIFQSSRYSFSDSVIQQISDRCVRIDPFSNFYKDSDINNQINNVSNDGFFVALFKRKI